MGGKDERDGGRRRLGRWARRVGGLVEDVQARVLGREEEGTAPGRAALAARRALDAAAHAEAVRSMSDEDRAEAWARFAARWRLVAAAASSAAGTRLDVPAVPSEAAAGAGAHGPPEGVLRDLAAALDALDGGDVEGALDRTRAALRHAGGDGEARDLALVASGVVRAAAGDRARAERDLAVALGDGGGVGGLGQPLAAAVSAARMRLALDAGRWRRAVRGLEAGPASAPGASPNDATAPAKLARFACLAVEALVAAVTGDVRTAAARVEALGAVDRRAAQHVGACAVLAAAHRTGRSAGALAASMGVEVGDLPPRLALLWARTAADPRRAPWSPAASAGDLDPYRAVLDRAPSPAARAALVAEACHVAVVAGNAPGWLAEAVAAESSVAGRPEGLWVLARTGIESRPPAARTDEGAAPVPGVESPLADPDLREAVAALAAFEGAKEASLDDLDAVADLAARVHPSYLARGEAAAVGPDGGAGAAPAVEQVLARLSALGQGLAAAAAFEVGPLAAAGGEAAQAIAAAARAAAGPVRVVFAGGFSAGKSTLVDALVGAALLPVGALATTNTIAKVRRGERAGAVVAYRDGRRRSLDGEAVPSFLADLEPAQAASIRSVCVERPDLPWDDLVLCDVPGFDALEPYHAAVAEARLAEADAVVWVLAATGGVGAHDADRIARLRAQGRAVFVVVNKIDAVPAGDRDRLLAHVRERLGLPAEAVVPACGRALLEAAVEGAPDDPGRGAFVAWFERQVVARGRAHKRAGLAGRLRHVATTLETVADPSGSLEDLGERAAGAAQEDLLRSAGRLADRLVDPVADAWVRALLSVGVVRVGSARLGPWHEADGRLLLDRFEHALDRAAGRAFEADLSRWPRPLRPAAEAAVTAALRAAVRRGLEGPSPRLLAGAAEAAAVGESDLRTRLAANLEAALRDAAGTLDEVVAAFEPRLRVQARAAELGRVRRLAMVVAVLARASAAALPSPREASVGATSGREPPPRSPRP